MEATVKGKWNEILEVMKTENDVTNVAHRTWLLPLSVLSVEEDTVTLSADRTKLDRHGLEFVKLKYGPMIRSAMIEVLGETYSLEFVISPDLSIETDEKVCNAENEVRNDIAKRMVQDHVLTFEKIAEYCGLQVSEVKMFG